MGGIGINAVGRQDVSVWVPPTDGSIAVALVTIMVAIAPQADFIVPLE
jgi:hypothetical protein